MKASSHTERTETPSFEESIPYFKMQVGEPGEWLCVRLQLNRAEPLVWVNRPPEILMRLAPGCPVSTRREWSCVALPSKARLGELCERLRALGSADAPGRAPGSDD